MIKLHYFYMYCGFSSPIDRRDCYIIYELQGVNHGTLHQLCKFTQLETFLCQSKKNCVRVHEITKHNHSTNTINKPIKRTTCHYKPNPTTIFIRGRNDPNKYKGKNIGPHTNGKIQISDILVRCKNPDQMS